MRSARLLFITLIVASFHSSITAAVTPEISAEFRARSEANVHRGLPPKGADDADNIRSYLRTRLNLKLSKDSLAYLFVQIQDSRAEGDNAGTSGGLTNDINLGVHQAYIDFEYWIWKKLHGRIGRQELSYGNERLIGTVGWHNVGRSFDGAKVTLKLGGVSLEAVGATLTERDPADGSFLGGGRDNVLGVLAAKLEDIRTEFLFIYDADLRAVYDPVDSFYVGRRLARGTFSVFSAGPLAGAIDYVANAAVQAGKAVPGANELDIEAYMLALELGYTIPGSAKARIALGIDHASGDDGQEPTKRKEFNNLFYTGHKFRGFIDNFLAPSYTGTAQATAGLGLTDIQARLALNLHRRWRAGVDVHHFRTAEDYVSLVGGSSQKTIGAEFDTWVRAVEFKGLDWEYGGSVFFWSEDYAGANTERTQLWGYSQITLNLK